MPFVIVTACLQSTLRVVTDQLITNKNAPLVRFSARNKKKFIFLINKSHPMQQIPSQNSRSSARPMIWITLALHLALGAFLYLKTSGEHIQKMDEPSKEKMELPANP